MIVGNGNSKIILLYSMIHVSEQLAIKPQKGVMATPTFFFVECTDLADEPQRGWGLNCTS